MIETAASPDFWTIAAIVITGVSTVLAVIGANIALISWLRSDMKSFEQESRSDMKIFSKEIRGWKDEIYKEMKDFHGRLCSLEEKSKLKTDP